MSKLSKPNTVPVPDEFFDTAMKELTDAELRVLLVIINKTLRWITQWVWIEEEQFITATGGRISSAGIFYALNGRTITSSNGEVHQYDGLVKKGYVLRKYVCAECGHTSIEFSSNCPECKHGKSYKPHYALDLGDELMAHLKVVKGKAKNVPSKKSTNVVSPNSENRLTSLATSTNDVSDSINKVLQETSLQETTTTTSTNNTDQHIPGDRGLTPAEAGVTEKAEEVEEKGKCMTIKEFLDHAKEMVIDPMYRNPRRNLTQNEESRLTLFYKKYGPAQAKAIIDKTAEKGRYGLDGISMMLEDMGLVGNGKPNKAYPQLNVARPPNSRSREARQSEMARELDRMTKKFIHSWQFEFSDEEKKKQVDFGYANDEGQPTPKLLNFWKGGLEIVESNRDF